MYAMEWNVPCTIFLNHHTCFQPTVSMSEKNYILGLQSISRDAENNGSHPRRLDPTVELITYSFVLYLQNGRRDVKCKPSIR